MTTSNDPAQKIESELSNAKFTSESSLPPVDQWNPPFCGDLDIRIANDGNWYYEGEQMKRQAMVNLFARVLRLDEDGEYYLVTPGEKVRIKVDTAPFYVTEYRLDDMKPNPTILFNTKTGDHFKLGKEHPLVMQQGEGGQSLPLVLVRRNLFALISRPVFYQLTEMANEIETPTGTQWFIESDGERFVLG
jgi:hypothetical protein